LNHPSKRQFGPFVIDVEERVLRRDALAVPLTPKAFDLLTALIEQPGRLLSKDDLLQKVWPDTFVEESNLAYHVFALRKALGDTAEAAQYIENVPKRGYRFAAEVTPVHVEASAQSPTSDELQAPRRLSASVSEHGDKAVLTFRRDFHQRQALAEMEVASVDPPTQDLELQPDPIDRRRPSRSLSKRGLVVLSPVALVLLYVAAQWWRAPPAHEPLRALPLTSFAGVVRSPSLSPDGNYVTFSWNGSNQDNFDIYVQQIGAGTPHRLTTDPRNDYSPSWSPDGRTIAFLRRVAEDTSDLWRIAPLGGTERQVATIHPRFAFFKPTLLAWCPDSTCLLLSDSPGRDQSDAIFAVSLDRGEKRQLTHPPALRIDSDPDISPDGRSLIFRRDVNPFSGEFHRLALTGGPPTPDGEPVRLTSTLTAGKATWMPDSRGVVFASRGGLWRFDALRGTAPTRLAFVGQDGLTPVVSRTLDGRERLVYVRSFSDTNVWRVDTSVAGAPATSRPVVAIASTRQDQLPNLSPDGRRVVFLSNRSGANEIWLADPDGTNAFELTSMDILPGFARWSPKGDLIAFHGDPNGRPDVLIVPSAGGPPRILTSDARAGAYPSFSRDGHWVYFSSGIDKGENRIWKMPVAGGAAVEVTTTAGSIAIESAGGDLYYVDVVNRPGSVWWLPAGVGTAIKILDGVVRGNFDVIDGGIYYIDSVAGRGDVPAGGPLGETRLQFFDFATRRSTLVAPDLGTVGFGLTASRDGRTVFYSRVDSSVDELMVVDGFR